MLSGRPRDRIFVRRRDSLRPHRRPSCHHRARIEIEANIKQTVYVYKCERSTLVVKGKTNAITIDGCKKFAREFWPPRRRGRQGAPPSCAPLAHVPPQPVCDRSRVRLVHGHAGPGQLPKRPGAGHQLRAHHLHRQDRRRPGDNRLIAASPTTRRLPDELTTRLCAPSPRPPCLPVSPVPPQVYLSATSLETQIVSAKSSEMNVLVPGPDGGDMVETPLPEQYKSTYENGKWVTEQTDIAG